jgi:hypothetical protein
MQVELWEDAPQSCSKVAFEKTEELDVPQDEGEVISR